MDIVGWTRLRSGKTADMCRAKFERAGVPSGDWAPIYIDQPTPKVTKLTVDHMPELRKAMNSLMAGGQLVVLALGDFGVARVWSWAADRLAEKKSSLRNVETGAVYDFAADPAVGYAVSALVEKEMNRSRTEKMRAARIASGHLGPREKLLDPALKRKCARLWADPNLSAAMVAEQTRISAPTLYRHLGPKGEAEAKYKA